MHAMQFSNYRTWTVEIATKAGHDALVAEIAQANQALRDIILGNAADAEGTVYVEFDQLLSHLRFRTDGQIDRWGSFDEKEVLTFYRICDTLWDYDGYFEQTYPMMNAIRESFVF